MGTETIFAINIGNLGNEEVLILIKMLGAINCKVKRTENFLYGSGHKEKISRTLEEFYFSEFIGKPRLNLVFSYTYGYDWVDWFRGEQYYCEMACEEGCCALDNTSFLLKELLTEFLK